MTSILSVNIDDYSEYSDDDNEDHTDNDAEDYYDDEYQLGATERWTRRIPKGYKLVWTTHSLYCTCPAYRFQSIPSLQRTCKHMETYYPDWTPVGGAKRECKQAPPSFPQFLPYEESKIDPKTMWWSEDFAGVRVWKVRGDFVVQTGRTVDAPSSFLKQLPDADHLDMIFFVKGQSREAAQVAIDMGPACTHWKDMRVAVLDSDSLGKDLSFEERYQELLELESGSFKESKASRPWFIPRQHKFRSLEHLKDRVDGYESVLIRNRNSAYDAARNAGYRYRPECKGVGILIEVGDTAGAWRVLAMKPAQTRGQVFTLHCDDMMVKPGELAVYTYKGISAGQKPLYTKLLSTRTLKGI